MTPQPGRELRIGDAERDAAVSALGEHFAEGRLTKDEYDERSAQAWTARTRSQLAPLFADLPGPEAPRSAATVPTGRPAYGRSHRGWWAGAWLAPLLAVLVVLVVLSHLPVFLLLLVGWLMFVRLGRHWARRNRTDQWSYRWDHQRRGHWVR